MKKFLFASVCSASVVGFASAASAATITFNEFSGVGNPLVTTLNSGGFNFASTHFHSIANGQTAFANNGSTYIADDVGSAAANIVMTMIGGGSFTLNSFDVAELFVRNQPERPNGAAVLVIGMLSGGGTVTQTFSLDLFNDGTGSGVDFQTFFLSSVFTDLVSVTFRGLLGAGGGAIGLDNIVVDETTVPLPAAGLLLLTGVAGAAMARRRKARTAV